MKPTEPSENNRYQIFSSGKTEKKTTFRSIDEIFYDRINKTAIYYAAEKRKCR